MGKMFDFLRRKSTLLAGQSASQKSDRGNLFFQPKLTVGPSDDVYEREADATADRVMRMSGSETVQTKISQVDDVQRECVNCEEEEVQKKEAVNVSGSSEAPGIVSEALQTGGQALDDGTRSFMESRFGYDFSSVKIHTDTVAEKSAESINALAYTSGNDIVFNEGQYAPESDSGKKLLAHELTHVIQQKGTDIQKKTIQRNVDENEHAESVAESDLGPVEENAVEQGNCGGVVPFGGNLTSLREFSFFSSGACPNVTVEISAMYTPGIDGGCCTEYTISIDGVSRTIRNLPAGCNPDRVARTRTFRMRNSGLHRLVVQPVSECRGDTLNVRGRIIVS
jgi:hypothetical protein